VSFVYARHSKFSSKSRVGFEKMHHTDGRKGCHICSLSAKLWSAGKYNTRRQNEVWHDCTQT